MKRYERNHWTVKLARLGHRLERATDTAIEYLWNQDHASWHFERRGLGRSEEISAWWAGFKAGWKAAATDGNFWFELAEEAPTVPVDPETQWPVGYDASGVHAGKECCSACNDAEWPVCLMHD